MKPAPASLVAGAAIWLLLAAAGCTQPAHQWNGEEVRSAKKPQRLNGVNWDGQPFSLEDLRGKVVVVFFGYTYCPDVCPFTLAKMKQLKAELGEHANEVAVVFASVDPQRDTVEKLSHYVPNFDREFYGLRLEQNELDVAMASFGLTVQYGQPKDGPGTNSYYYVDHTGTFFVVDQDGKLRLKFPPNATVDQMRPDILTLLTA